VAIHHQDLVVTNDLATLSQVRDLVANSVRKGGFSPLYLNRLQIAVDEAVTNIIEHGYEGRPRGTGAIQISASVSPDEFRILIVDQGSSFDPAALTDIDIETHVRAGHGGGLGVFLMRKIMDVIDYQYETGRRNRLLLVKFASGSSSARHAIQPGNAPSQ
jgi:anti-sigma regulatory factor (Ser/Thr protein kinase)